MRIVVACAAAALCGCDPRVTADPSGLGESEIGRYFANSPADGSQLNDELRDLVVGHLRASHGVLTPKDQRALGVTCANATTCTYAGSTVLRDDPRLALPGPRRRATTHYDVEVLLLPPDDARVTVSSSYHLANG